MFGYTVAVYTIIGKIKHKFINKNVIQFYNKIPEFQPIQSNKKKRLICDKSVCIELMDAVFNAVCSELL